MKKSELSIGLRVELANGQPGTVVDVGGWSRGDAGNWSTYRITDKNGRHIRVIGFVGGAGVVVVWDHGPVIDGMATGSIETPQSLRPVGTRAAARAAEAAEEARRTGEATVAADEARARVTELWGAYAAPLLARYDVPAAGPMDNDQAFAVEVIIACGEFR